MPLKLVPQLVPETLWGKSAYQLFGRRALWKRIRTDALTAANRTCEICDEKPSEIFGDPLTCHEVWHYDDKKGTATLTQFKIQCHRCDAASHMGRTVYYGGGNLALLQLCKVNRVDTEKARGIYRDAMAVWKKRNKRKWKIRVAKSLLKQYPQLAALIESKH